jgi:putative oxidoreductase
LQGWLVPPAKLLQSVFLLIVRLYWGWQFFQTGKGKLIDISKPTEYFARLGIPFAHAQAILAGSIECLGGLFVLVGLASRFIPIPLLILLSVAYCTADFDRLKVIFSDPDRFLAADEFLFFFAIALVLIFGPGKLSIDALIAKYYKPRVSIKLADD